MNHKIISIPEAQRTLKSGSIVRLSISKSDFVVSQILKPGEELICEAWGLRIPAICKGPFLPITLEQADSTSQTFESMGGPNTADVAKKHKIRKSSRGRSPMLKRSNSKRPIEIEKLSRNASVYWGDLSGNEEDEVWANMEFESDGQYLSLVRWTMSDIWGKSIQTEYLTESELSEIHSNVHQECLEIAEEYGLILDDRQN